MSHTKSSRRDFIKTSAGAALIAFPAIWAGPYAEAKNDRLIGAAIGVGGRGSGIARNASKHADIIACCDVDRNHAEKFSEKLGPDCKMYEDYRELLQKEKLDFVTIGTPDHWHTAIAVDAMKTGLDVYCEKPLTLTIDEGKILCNTVKKTGRIFQVGTQQRSEYGLKFLKAVALVRNGHLGKSVNAICSIGGGKSGGPFETMEPPAHLNWDFWLGQAPKVAYCPQRCHGNFRWWFEYSGGKMTDWGAHHVDIAQWALGYEHSGPIEIEGWGKFPNIPNGYNTATQFEITLRYDNGSNMIVRHGPGNGIWLKGENGELFVNRKEIKGEILDKMSDAEKKQLEEDAVALYKGKQPGNHMRNFFDCIKDRSEPISDVFTHHRSITSCHLCNIAILLKRKLKWDPQKQDFIGDKEAHKMLTRDQRKPYIIHA